ncbi:MAG: heme biosynthesis HemY N-terminal domain-containing protein [Thalassotalea sp.]
MKRLLIIIVLFFLAIAVSPYLIGEKGYILIAFGDFTVESTVVTAGIFLLVLFITLLLSLKLLRGGFKLGQGTWRKITFAGRRKAERQFNQGIAAYLLGDYQQAEQLLSKSAEYEVMPQSGYALAADAAHKQKLSAKTEYYLDCLVQNPEVLKDSLVQILVIISQQLQLKNYQKARSLIDEYHKHIGHDYRLFSLEIELSLIEQRFEHVIEYLPKALKDKNITQVKINRWCQQAFLGHFSHLLKTGGQAQLEKYWLSITKKLKQQQEVVFAYCYVLAQHGLNNKLEEYLLPSFKFNADADYLKRIRELPLNNVDSLLNEAQKHLHKDPHSVKWLGCLGFLAYTCHQYDMAVKAYASLLKLDQGFDQQDRLFYAKALIAKQEYQQANQLLLQ